MRICTEHGECDECGLCDDESRSKISLEIRKCADVAWDLGGERAKSLADRLHSIAAELKRNDS